MEDNLLEDFILLMSIFRVLIVSIGKMVFFKKHNLDYYTDSIFYKSG